MDFCKLEDLGFIGHPFTWSNNRGGNENLQERLDRFVATNAWKERPGLGGLLYAISRSGSRIIYRWFVVSIKERVGSMEIKRRKKLYRFEEMWLRDEKCIEVIIEASR